MQSFKAGLDYWRRSERAGIPIKLDGLFELKKRRQFFVRPGTVSVTFGEPVKFSDRTNTGTDHARTGDKVREL
jgi:1-acyl-sn-glycerol-3-phosphate acyltransferase